MHLSSLKHLIALRVVDVQGNFVELFFKPLRGGFPLHVLHDLQDRDARLRPQAARMGLKQLTQQPQGSPGLRGRVAALLQRVIGGEQFTLQAIMHPRANLLQRLKYPQTVEDHRAVQCLFQRGDLRTAELGAAGWYVMEEALAALKQMLEAAPALGAEGTRTADSTSLPLGCWIAENAQIGTGVRLGAGVSVGANAQVEQESVLLGAAVDHPLPALIGPCCRVEAGCVVRAVLQPGVRIKQGVCIDSHTAVLLDNQVLKPLYVRVCGQRWSWPLIPAEHTLFPTAMPRTVRIAPHTNNVL